ncbi:MAG: chemotaxis protein CheA, partial [Burkholderiales bacterium]
MNVDLRQFHQVFFEETLEHLDTLERVLLLLAHEAPEREQIDALFRAAHSIKGGAGTFGFPDLAQIAHLLENSLDRVRRGQIELNAPLIDVALRAVDLLRRQLAAHRGQGEADPAALAALPT